MAESMKNLSKSPAIKLIAVLAIGVGLAGLYYQNSRALKGAQRVTFAVQRGDLRVTVLEGGNIEARESQEIKSQIRGRNGAKILSIIEEGYLVSQEDIDNGLILVELDPSDIEDQLVNQEIATQTAEATYIERKAQYEIQLNQNQRNSSEVTLTVKFARMDFEKYLGEDSVQGIIDFLGLEERFKEKPEEAATPMPAPKPSLGGARGERSSRSGAGGEGRRSWQGGQRGENGSEGQAGQGRQRRQGGSEGEAGQGRPGGQGRSGGSGGFGGQRGGFGGGGGDRMEQMKKMIADNGGKLPSFMKDRLGDMGMTEEEFLAMVNGGDAGGRRPRPEPPAAEEPLQMDIAVTLDDEYLRLRDSIDFSKYADIETLEDGQAKQILSTYQADELVAEEDERLAASRVEGQERLFAQKFITKNELELEVVKGKKAEIRVNTARMEQELYIKYTFPKEAEKLFFDYEDALMGLVRQRKEGEARMAQENAKLKSAERKYNLARDELEDLQDQLSKTVIRAERIGLVVYGSSGNTNPFRRSTEEPIQEGATVRERQRIITIPDMTRMGVKVNIHESAVKRVQVGQSVSIAIDAYPGRVLEGKVVKIAVLADSANAFMNPDLKVYPTNISIEGIHDWLRPGMSSAVKILVEELNDVLYIPIQAVTYEGDNQICYVMKNGSLEKRVVTLGSFTEEFIEITGGLEEGEEVLLLAPGSGVSESESTAGDSETASEPAA